MRDKLLALAFLWVLCIVTNPAHALTCTLPEVIMYKTGQWGAPSQARSCGTEVRMATPDEAELCFKGYATPMTTYSDNYQLQAFSVTPGSNQTYTARYTYSQTRTYADGRTPPPPSPGTWSLTLNPVCGVPPPPDDCQDKQGDSINSRTSSTALGSICVEGCRAQPGSGSFSQICIGAGCDPGATPWYGQFTFTGEQCETNDAEGETGVTCDSSSGNAVCNDTAEPNCITINGKKQCFNGDGKVCSGPDCTDAADHVKNDDGSEMANANQPTPPVPDNGTAGQRATPDAQATVRGTTGSTTTTQTYHYWNGTTAANSTTNRSDNDGQCEAGEQGTPDCTQDPGGDCDPEEEDCSGSGKVSGEGGTAKTFTASTGAFYQRVKNAPLIASMGNIAGSIGVGECPLLAFEAFGQTISTTFHCDLAENLSMLTYLLIALYSLAGIRIVMSA